MSKPLSSSQGPCRSFYTLIFPTEASRIRNHFSVGSSYLRIGRSPSKSLVKLRNRAHLRLESVERVTSKSCKGLRDNMMSWRGLVYVLCLKNSDPLEGRLGQNRAAPSKGALCNSMANLSLMMPMAPSLCE